MSTEPVSYDLEKNKTEEPVPCKKQKTKRHMPKYLIVTTTNRDYMDECDDLGVWQFETGNSGNERIIQGKS